MKNINLHITFFLITLSSICIAQTKSWTSKNAQISFFSNAPLENIEASSKTGLSALNTKTGDIIFKVWNKTFEFDKKLMQEHFNENYMESEKYPISEFRGKISDSYKMETDGSYELSVSGTLNIHGVTKLYNTKANIKVANEMVVATCSFNIRLADHKIKIPAVVGKNIAEVVNVKINATFKQ